MHPIWQWLIQADCVCAAVASVLQVIRVLQQRSMLPAIWFIMSRRDCDLSAIAAASDVELVTPDEAAQLNDEVQQLL